ncbi:hypothetical protein C7G43_31660 [Bradyrhizobium sp. MOS004]|nr:hypothetical protein C7G43_31660 [Bradyrhizobium sp. MOS004]PVI46892.1 hypothetical protein C4870_23930 [Salmonella enterica subsp. enterica serovar Anatum]HAQ81248.1 hypothetical protein [Bradyrhizobium sp.]HAR18228.1 hypothetical protein [Bradyrhizobium sp.]HAR25606.1 hypothetical protein [Bradyrhizobium sp.]
MTTPAALTSIIMLSAVDVFIFSFGTFYIYRLLRAGPARRAVQPRHGVFPKRPMSLVAREFTEPQPH